MFSDPHMKSTNSTMKRKKVHAAYKFYHQKKKIYVDTYLPMMMNKFLF